MPKLERKTPCAECPFRRDSRPGWLGAETDPKAFTEGALCDYDEHPLPCHMEIDYTDPDWRTTQLPDAPLCAGALIMCANNAKLPHDPERAGLVQSVERSDIVFRYAHEFEKYHSETKRGQMRSESEVEDKIRQTLDTKERPDRRESPYLLGVRDALGWVLAEEDYISGLDEE